MLDATWNLFYQTGNIETYLLLKELEQQKELNPEQEQNKQTRSSSYKSIDLPSV
ncbi:YqzL family protein [Oceanobacillus jeddahense]|uniref:YqzL family protein n=1 Tax=Oceanobacillus jeddahense TaxID=1462527 RepID=A0ABY5JM48_9BACI|nr:YqzL family protein [Oceanobacillus jeddahense]UUI01364.1 YqzL family protein [Oceanobacillus jeddahense]